ncbi:MAG: hypothetical protein CVU99_11115 [Firmicutes bacterium HGW-Firmicutes-4]|nr:MAG: hypothetical protein CVU99_11115 [Firmicutes bacterium HGW-Firmicutes-4]
MFSSRKRYSITSILAKIMDYVKAEAEFAHESPDVLKKIRLTENQGGKKYQIRVRKVEILHRE